MSDSALQADNALKTGAKSEPPPPTAWAQWKSCRAKTCCTRGARDVNGADIVRISRTLALEPWHFTQTSPAAADDPAGIILEGGRRRVNLALANAAHGCVFLIRTVSGAASCGIGDVAPVSCRVFPANPAGGSDAAAPDPPAARVDHGCQCRQWTSEDVDAETTREPLSRWAADRAHWVELIRRWNAQSTANPSQCRTVEDFQRYLLEAQGAREAGVAWPEEVRA
jgi:Fe-S-cluster containining protein